MATTPEPQPSSPSQSFDWKTFSQKTWVIVATGLALPPLGMILAWLKPGWSTKSKWVATGLLSLLLVARMQATKDAPRQQEPASVTGRSEKVVNSSGGMLVESPDSPSSRRTPRSSDERAYYKYGFEEGQREGKELAAYIEEHITQPHMWRSTLMQRVKDLRRVMDIEADSSIPNSTWNSRGRYEGFMSVVKAWVEKAEAETRSNDSGAIDVAVDASAAGSLSLTRNWFERFDKYVERVINTTLSSHEGKISQLDLKVIKRLDGKYDIQGEVTFTGGGQRHLSGWVKGSDFGWLSSRSAYWATNDDARYWDSKGNEMSRDDFCSKWMDSSFLEIRRRQNESSDRNIKSNLETFKKIYERQK